MVANGQRFRDTPEMAPASDDQRRRSFREQFQDFAAGPDANLDVATGALLITGEDSHAVDIEQTLAAFEQLADAVRPQLQGAGSDHDLVARLNRALFEEQQFRGNREDYYDPRNSYLDVVVERRLGIPITLSIVYVEVARRLGIDAHGVGFPGHFLTRVNGDQDAVFVDAFGGQTLSRADCERQLQSQFGPRAELAPELLAPTEPRQILTRVLSNLKQIYAQRGQVETAIACCDRALLLLPDNPTELRDRGLLYRSIECFGPAADDLERFLTLAPPGAETQPLSALVRELRERASRLQ